MENENKTPETNVTDNTNTNTPVTEKETEQKVDYEAELAKAMADIKKLKAIADKNASEAADFKKKWRSTLDEQERLNLEKEEADKALREELETLRRERDFSKTEKQFLSVGYSAELASQAAQAQLEGNLDKLLEVQKKYIEQVTKGIVAEQTKNMPTPPISNDSETSMTQEEFDKLTVREQVEFKNKFPELFKKYTEN